MQLYPCSDLATRQAVRQPGWQAASQPGASGAGLSPEKEINLYALIAIPEAAARPPMLDFQLKEGAHKLDERVVRCGPLSPPTLISCFALCAVFAFGRSYSVLFLARALQGIGSSCSSVSGKLCFEKKVWVYESTYV